MKKKKFDYEAFAEGLNAECVRAVNAEMDKDILVTQNDLFQMALIFRKTRNNEYMSVIKQAFKGASADFVITDKGLKHRGITTIKMNNRMKWAVILGIESFGDNGDQFKLCRHIIDWYGVERARMKHFKEYIPQDNRQRYAEDSYTGTTRDEFIFDNVGMKYEDEKAMESAIVNNKWMMDQLIP